MRPRLLCPGKLAASIDRFMTVTRFNEAEAVMPRKAKQLVDLVAACFDASMRPRLLCPGKPDIVWSLTRRAPSFNEAEAVMPRKAASMPWQIRATTSLQ